MSAPFKRLPFLAVGAFLALGLPLACLGGGEVGVVQPIDATASDSATDVAYQGPTKGAKRPDGGTFQYDDVPPVSDAEVACCPITLTYHGPAGGTVSVVGVSEASIPLAYDGAVWTATVCQRPRSFLAYRFQVTPSNGPAFVTTDAATEQESDNDGVFWNVQVVPACFADAGLDAR